VRYTKAELKTNNSLEKAGEHVETLSGERVRIEVYISTGSWHTQTMPAKIRLGNRQPSQSEGALRGTIRGGHCGDHSIQTLRRRVVDHQGFATVKMAYGVHYIFAGGKTHIGAMCSRVISGLAKCISCARASSFA